MDKITKFLQWCHEDFKKFENRNIKLRNKREGAIMNFALIADEADHYGATRDGTTQVQKAYRRLTALGPRIMVNVTATPYSLFKNFEDYDVPHEVVAIKPDPKEYYGLSELVPFKDARGQDVFLQHDEVTVRSGFIFGGKRVPSTCKKSKMFYEQAVMDHKKGVLLVDISNHLVHCANNICEKALLSEFNCDVLSVTAHVVWLTFFLQFRNIVP